MILLERISAFVIHLAIDTLLLMARAARAMGARHGCHVAVRGDNKESCNGMDVLADRGDPTSSSG